ncbi:MAG: folylpolyglutamate synthase/dihydrofolate synthase family protein [Balneolaceae bacterium]|nr:folylpolyglutamate synthase/dihydrofolate synthase family protein [Balneolaceae bacterium]
MKLNTLEDLHRYLDKIPMFKDRGTEAARFELERFQRFCKAIGDPQETFRSIHVAGTNGKGSTCRIVSTVYHVAGYKTAMYTSPHLMDYRDRFQIDGELIPESELLHFFNSFHELLERHQLTYFEISTAVAFWWFCRQQVDLAVIEVGLGGRLDATNIITPEVSVITNISLDHTDILGNTVEEIAREKAGIIKAGRPVVVGNVGDIAKAAIKDIADHHDSPFFDAMTLQPRFEDRVPVIGQGTDKLKLETSLESSVQMYNLAVAWQVISIQKERFPISEKQFKQAVKEIRTIFTLPGRFEKLHPQLNWYFDGAHNIEAVEALISTVSTIASLDRSILVLSIMRDKVTPEIMAEFQKFKKIYYYTEGSKRAANVGDIVKWVPEVQIISGDKKEQVRLLKELKSELVIFAGSFYFYATVQKWLKSLHPNH